MITRISPPKSDIAQSYEYSAYASRWVAHGTPKQEIPLCGMSAQAAYQLISDELNLDGNPTLNLASFVTTWMEPEARQLITESLDKNFIDEDEYPQTKVIHDRVVHMLGRMLHAPDGAVGTLTIGSSEAIMLALLAHKWRWRKRRQQQNSDWSNPNIVFGADVHSCWEKFALYFDVEMRVIPLSENKYTINGEDVLEYVDENTIAVGAVIGTTFTGQVDDLKSINDCLEELQRTRNWDIPIHLDAASGGFIAPFAYPKEKFDFRMPKVRSINLSNHKFGFVYPGLGTVLFRHADDIPEELVFKINYLGGEMPNFSLNFSKGSSCILAQYYNLLRLGRSGYHKIVNNIMTVASYLEKRLIESGNFAILTDVKHLPVVVVKLTEQAGHTTVFALSDELRKNRWIVPAYTLPPDAEHIAVLRIVVKENFTHDMAEMLVSDIDNALQNLKNGHDHSDQFTRGRINRIC